MRKLIPLAILGLAVACGPASSEEGGRPDWAFEQVVALKQAIDAAPREALPRFDTTELDRAVNARDDVAIDKEATFLATRLAQAKLHGCAAAAERTGWNINDAGDTAGLGDKLSAAIANGNVGSFLDGLSPRHPDYAALVGAYAAEADPEKRKTIARNLERWRWMPQSLGESFVRVNAPAFEVHLWRGAKPVGTWPVIVGKRSTPTPVFSATISGVIYNPWWEIPASIVRENGGRFSASKGYVYSNGRWRQRPGPGNALGQMKLYMPNGYNVYLHDTPSKQLFSRPVRAFSHGCIRVGDALGFARTLLDGVKTGEQIDTILESGRTTHVDIAVSMPVYITYFTAGTDANGAVAIYPDIYGRDARLADHSNPQRQCTPP